MLDQSRLGLLRRDGQDAANLLHRRRLTKLHEVHERLDCGQPDVSGARTIGACGFQVMQEADDQRRIDLLQVQL